MPFLTDKQVQKFGLDPGTAQRTLADAEAVYGYVQRVPWATQDQLAQWAEKNLGDEPDVASPDRLNAAVAFLTETGRLLEVQT